MFRTLYSSVAACACILLAALGPIASRSAAAEAPASVHLRVVGGLAGVNQFTHHEQPFWLNELPRLSKGALTAEIVPFDRAGIRGQEMLRLVQLGTVPFGTALLSLSGVDDPELFAPDLPGLNPDIASIKRNAIAFRPYLEKLLRDRYGAELLALYIYPAQDVFCKRPLGGLADLADRRVRVSNAAQADFVLMLHAVPVQTSFADIPANLRSGNIDCAVTGTMSGNTIGLDELSTQLYTMSLGWGLAAFVANGSAWAALPASEQDLLRKELARVERDIWNESDRQTAEGIACNVGAASCVDGHRGHMQEVRPSAADDTLRRKILAQRVLPGWVQRCGPSCAELWAHTIGPASGITVR